MKVFCAFILISHINLSLMLGTTFKSLFQSSTRPDLQKRLRTRAVDIQWDLQKPTEMGLKAGTSGSRVRQRVRMCHSFILAFYQQDRWLPLACASS